jgi:hypothetical protein
MEHVLVKKSSHIMSVGYDPDRREMQIAFHNGKTYSYPNVPEHVHKTMMVTGSKGEYFHRHINSKFKGVEL